MGGASGAEAVEGRGGGQIGARRRIGEEMDERSEEEEEEMDEQEEEEE